MASSSESVAPPNPPPSLEQEIHDLKRNLIAHRGFLLQLHREGGKRFEMLEEYLIQLGEEFIEALMHTMQQVNGRIMELESRVEKMELQVARTTL